MLTPPSKLRRHPFRWLRWLKPRKGWMTQYKKPRDWASFGLSVGAFFFGTIAFLNSIKREDDVRAVVVNQAMVRFHSTKQPSAAIFVNQKLTLLNAGNRSVAVTAVRLKVTQPQDKSKRDCKNTQSNFIYYRDFTPFVTKPNDISVTQLRPIVEASDVESIGWNLFALRNPSADKETSIVLICLSLSLVTPDNVADEIDIPLSKHTINPNAPAIMNFEGLEGWATPYLLVKQRYTALF
jgi:hypothetical protein